MSIDIFDVLAIAGFGLLVTGIALVHIPAALVVAGFLMLALALYGSQRMSGN